MADAQETPPHAQPSLPSVFSLSQHLPASLRVPEVLLLLNFRLDFHFVQHAHQSDTCRRSRGGGAGGAEEEERSTSGHFCLFDQMKSLDMRLQTQLFPCRTVSGTVVLSSSCGRGFHCLVHAPGLCGFMHFKSSL